MKNIIVASLPYSIDDHVPVCDIGKADQLASNLCLILYMLIVFAFEYQNPCAGVGNGDGLCIEMVNGQFVGFLLTSLVFYHGFLLQEGQFGCPITRTLKRPEGTVFSTYTHNGKGDKCIDGASIGNSHTTVPLKVKVFAIVCSSCSYGT